MTKILLYLFTLFFSLTLNAQSNFEYSRTWGTYIGPVGSKSWTEPTTKTMLFDNQDNIHLTGLTFGYPNNYPHSYYDQFRVGGGGQNFTMTTASNSYSNGFAVRLTPNGMVNSYEYYNSLINTSGYRKKLKYIDKDNNFYYEYAAQIPFLPITPTPNSWQQNHNDPQLGTLLVKENSNGTVLWASCVPVNPQTYIYGVSPNIFVTGDEVGNIYLSAYSNESPGITTPGAFQENYQMIIENGVDQFNGYLIKLNGNDGSQIWGTYLPFFITNMAYHNGNLYLLGNGVQTVNQNIISTSNAFQSTPSGYVLQKFNATAGQRIWGTYYGHTTDNYSRINNIEVNDTGIFVMGDVMVNSVATAGYFGTPGTHQTISNGSGDLFLSKFNHNGNRLWSTYFGGTGHDMAQSAMQSLAIDGEYAYITGRTYATTNNIATPGSHKSSPTLTTGTVTNHFFAKFGADGSLSWASYYGDSHEGFNEPMNIAIHKSSLYLYGETTGASGYATPNSWQTQMIDPNPSAQQEKNVVFLAKFDIKSLSTQESNLAQRLILFDNPNNGNFTLKGDILEKENCKLIIYDLSGKRIHSQNLDNKKEQKIHLQGKLVKGTYVVQVKNTKETVANIKMLVNK